MVLLTGQRITGPSRGLGNHRKAVPVEMQMSAFGQKQTSNAKVRQIREADSA